MGNRHGARRHLPGDPPEFCHYCSKEITNRRDRTVDHIVPASLGGKSERFNYVISCRKCNEAKGDKWPTPSICNCSKCRKSVRIHREAYGIKKPK